MCGIAGGISFSGRFVLAEEHIRAVSADLRHRGPDAEGHLFERFGATAVAFAHTRLRIIDLSDLGNQPMRSLTGRSVIVFNGEIYNYRELRDELAGAGWQFRSQSDTEVVLNGFEAWGIEEVLRRVDGMFAFGLYHAPADTLYLARDPFGKKPCYYYRSPGGEVVFSSDVRSFKTIGINLHVDPHALGYFFQELSTPEEQTIWRQVKKLPPGSFLVASRNAATVVRYWTFRYTSDNRMNRNEVIEVAEDCLLRAVKKRLVADVQVSALLSGGVDSSLVVAFMAKSAGSRIATYSVGFEEDTFDELPYARLVADRYSTNHHEFVMRASDVMDPEALVREYGEPFGDSSMLASYLIAKTVSRSEKVALGGDGGDELFGGYYEYYFCNKLERVKRLGAFRSVAGVLQHVCPSRRTRFLRELLIAAARPRHTLLDRNMGFSREQTAALLPTIPAAAAALDQEHARVWREYAAPYDHILTQTMSGSLHTRLVNDYLVKIDRASMYASIEMRCPFLDRDLATFAGTLTPAQLMAGARTKSVLKDLGRRHLPPVIVERPKSGFSVPVGKWFRGSLGKVLTDVVLGGRQQIVPMNYGFVERLIKRHQNGADHAHRLWALYVFHVWAQTVGSGTSIESTAEVPREQDGLIGGRGAEVTW